MDKSTALPSPFFCPSTCWPPLRQRCEWSLRLSAVSDQLEKDSRSAVTENAEFRFCVQCGLRSNWFQGMRHSA